MCGEQSTMCLCVCARESEREKKSVCVCVRCGVKETEIETKETHKERE